MGSDLLVNSKSSSGVNRVFDAFPVTVSVRNLTERLLLLWDHFLNKAFDAQLRRSPFPQRKTLLHLIVKQNTLDTPIGFMHIVAWGFSGQWKSPFRHVASRRGYA